MATVNIIWSFEPGGNAIEDYVDHGDISNGSNSGGRIIYVRHDGENAITDVGFFIREYTGTYNGDATSNADIVEILSWGDGTTAAAFGGVMINWDAVNSFAADWPVWNLKDPDYAFVHQTGTGDSELNAVTLPGGGIAGTDVEGEIASGDNPGVRFKMRIEVPSNEDTVGVRLFDHVAKYTYTS